MNKYNWNSKNSEMKSKKKWVLIPGVFLGFLLISTWMLMARNESQYVNNDSGLQVSELLGESASEGFALAVKPVAFNFPEDHGPHPNFRNEWWYYTGNLEDFTGRSFGYQFTLFRNALSPVQFENSSNWRTNQIYMGHFALTDVEEKRFFFSERFSRGNAQLAGAMTVPFRVWLEDWEVTGDAGNKKFPQQIKAQTEDVVLSLELSSSKPLVLQGNQGHSQKGSRPGNASYYYSFTRMQTQGTLKIGDREFNVHGSSWMDREWSTSALEKGQKGWDWFALQLSDGREIMLYQIRRDNGKADLTSKGVIINESGHSIKLEWKDLDLKILSSWTSPETGIRYPSGWKLNIPSENLDLEIKPLIENQELRTSVNYWEGAVEVQSLQNDISLNGKGYVELTGYTRTN